MEVQRWNQLEEAFHRTLQCDARDRESYLLSVCGDDQELIDEVRALIWFYERPGEFLENSQVTIGLNILATESELAENEVLGPYIIQHRIGQGGMGDVYLAHDQRLG